MFKKLQEHSIIQTAARISSFLLQKGSISEEVGAPGVGRGHRGTAPFPEKKSARLTTNTITPASGCPGITHIAACPKSFTSPQKGQFHEAFTLVYKWGLILCEHFLCVYVLHDSYLSRSKDRLLGISDETFFAEQVSICTLCKLLEWKLPIAAAALNQLAVLWAVRDA